MCPLLLRPRPRANLTDTAPNARQGGTRATACIWSKKLLGINPQPNKYILYTNLAHASDWLPTLVLAAGGTTEGSLPLDGYNQWPNLVATAEAGRGMPVPDIPAPRREVFYGSPDEQRICYGKSQHSRSGGGLCLEQNAIRIGQWKLIVGDGGTPNTWFPPVNASRRHVAEPECEEPSSAYLTGAAHRNMESPFLSAAAAVDPELSCANISSWDEASCRPEGVSLGQFRVADAAACCAECGKEPTCKAWVFRSDVERKGQVNCWTKSSNSLLAKDKARQCACRYAHAADCETLRRTRVVIIGRLARGPIRSQKSYA